MPSPLSSGWLWPLTGGGRGPNRGVSREKSEPKLESKFDRLFDEEHQRRRRARSQSSRRTEKVFAVSKKEEIVTKEKNKGTRELCGQELRESAASLREEMLRVAPPERRPLPGQSQVLGSAERLALGLDCDEVLPGMILASGRTVIHSILSGQNINFHIIPLLGLCDIYNEENFLDIFDR